LEKPRLTWNTRLAGNKDFSSARELFAGSYSSKNDIEAEIQLWNNRWGAEDVENLVDFNIRIAFEKFEDSALLPFCTVSFRGKPLEMENMGTYAIAKMPIGYRILGQANNGIASENPGNFASFVFKFHVDDETIQFKENDLKSLYLEVIPL